MMKIMEEKMENEEVEEFESRIEEMEMEGEEKEI